MVEEVGIDGIEMLKDEPSSKKKKKGGSVSSRKSSSSRKSLKSSKSKSKSSSRRKVRDKDKKSSSSGLKVEDNISVISEDSLGTGSIGLEDDMSLKSGKSNKSSKSKSRRSERTSSSRRNSKSPMRSNSTSQLGDKKKDKRDANKRSTSLSNMAGKKEAKRSESGVSSASPKKSSSKRRGSMGAMSEKKSSSGHSRRGSMGSRSKRRGSISSSHSRFSTDDESMGFNPNVAKIDENGEYTKDLELSEKAKRKESSRKSRHNSGATDSTASSTSDGGSGAAIPTEIGGESTPDSKKQPPRESIMGYFSEDGDKPLAEEDLVAIMEERSKKLDASKDANLALTRDADQRVDLKAEAATVCASASGPEYVTDVWLTCNGERHVEVPVNSLQWYMFRYAELTNDTMDVYEEPREDDEELKIKLQTEADSALNTYEAIPGEELDV